jgi:putative sigma-54 modulation protein
MNVTYTGKQEYLHPSQQANIESKFSKLAKLLDMHGKGEKQAHVILTHNKNQHRAEITLNYLDHALVGEHTDPDQFTAINMALEKLEKQILKVRDKRRDIKKGPREGWDKGVSANSIIAAAPRNPEGLPASTNGKPKVFRVQPAETKPMTLEEALLVIENTDDYLVYQDAKSHRPAVLLRRQDGNFDLVEC